MREIHSQAQCLLQSEGQEEKLPKKQDEMKYSPEDMILSFLYSN